MSGRSSIEREEGSLTGFNQLRGKKWEYPFGLAFSPVFHIGFPLSALEKVSSPKRGGLAPDKANMWLIL